MHNLCTLAHSPLHSSQSPMHPGPTTVHLAHPPCTHSSPLPPAPHSSCTQPLYLAGLMHQPIPLHPNMHGLCSDPCTVHGREVIHMALMSGRFRTYSLAMQEPLHPLPSSSTDMLLQGNTASILGAGTGTWRRDTVWVETAGPGCLKAGTQGGPVGWADLEGGCPWWGLPRDGTPREGHLNG